MMKVLLKSALIYDPISSHHGKRRDILLQGNRILSIAPEIQENRARIIDGKNCVVSRGWSDAMARSGEPGNEFKEDFTSLKQAARRGGFTNVALLPSTKPATETKSAVQFILNQSDEQITFLPVGALSEHLQGKQLTEMFDLEQAGVVAFSDDREAISTELMCRALEYSQRMKGRVMVLPFDRSINGTGQMNESLISVSLGMKGIPNLAEDIRVQRDLELLRYCGGKIHFMLISSARSVEYIRKAKREGLDVTCSVAAHQLMFTDESLKSFDSNFKVLPPFRSKEDRKALIAGLKDDTIDAIVSDHCPEEVEHKIREFEDASFGISSIESTFCVAFTALEKSMSVGEIIEKFTTGPEKVFGMTPQPVGVGNAVSIFRIDTDTHFTSENWQSKSKNSPVIGMTLRGEVFQ
jgi:dihydroorotase